MKKTTMKKTNQQRISNAIIELDDLDSMITKQIMDYHNIKGREIERTALAYYRSQIWNAISTLKGK